jgi:hypothetical protein
VRVRGDPRALLLVSLRFPDGTSGERSRPRPIRTGQLRRLPAVHLRPINLVFCQGS